MQSIKRFLREKLKNFRVVKMAYRFYQPIFVGDGSPLKNRLRLMRAYLKERAAYKRADNNQSFKMDALDSFPCIYDRTANTDMDPAYFYQDSWCAKKVFENKPASHVDVASKVEMVGIISQFTPTTFIDIRPIDLDLAGLTFKKGSATDLPLDDDSVESLSSICVIEHIGLGRYGDDVDPRGSEKAMEEFERVLKPGGNLYVSVPIDNDNRVYFNAHRAFTRDYILKLARHMKLIEERYVYRREMGDVYDPVRGFGTGLYHFRKI